LRSGTKADAIVFHAKPQFTFEAFEGNPDSARPAMGKGMLDCIRDKLVDDQPKRRPSAHHLHVATTRWATDFSGRWCA
jgi:hypothetical protein